MAFATLPVVVGPSVRGFTLYGEHYHVEGYHHHY